jgi:hypothetical protein
MYVLHPATIFHSSMLNTTLILLLYWLLSMFTNWYTISRWIWRYQRVIRIRISKKNRQHKMYYYYAVFLSPFKYILTVYIFKKKRPENFISAYNRCWHYWGMLTYDRCWHYWGMLTYNRCWHYWGRLIGDLRLSCLDPFVILLPRGFKLFGFPTFRLWAYLVKVIPDKRRTY